MFALPHRATLAVLLTATAVMFLGHGLLSSLLGFRAGLEGFDTRLTGLMMSTYFVGYVAGAFLCVTAVKQVGHIRTFAALAAVYAAVAIAHALVVTPWSWTAFRFVSGICVVGLFLVIESWLNAEAQGPGRGRLFATYMVVYLAASAGGQLLLTTHDPAGFELFGVAAMLAALALVPIALTRVQAPAPHEPTGLSLRRLFQAAPIGVAGCFIDGMVGGSFWGMAALFGHQVGLDAAAVAFFLAATVVGGMLAQWPIGYVSDRTDRRRVMAMVALAAAAVCVALALLPAERVALLVAAGLAFGALTFPLYSLSVALVHDVLVPREALEATRGLMLVYGAGAMLGPALTGVAMDAFGARAMYALLALLCAGLAGYAALRVRRVAPTVTPAQQSTLVPAIQTSQEAAELTPEVMHPGTGG